MSETSQAYLADHRNGCRVVVRVLHPHLCLDATLAARFRREAYVANTITHPAIIKVIDDDELPDGRTVLVTDPVEGETLEDIRKAFGGRVPLDLAVDLITQVLDALECAHAEGIVHRNLRPELVLVQRGQVKIADFGFARLVNAAEDLTDMGLVLGTPQFLAPEQARGHRELVDAQSDLFAVGAILFLLLSGQHVHQSDSPDGFLYSATLSSARSLRMAVGEDLVPDEVVDVVDKALKFKKAERWLSAEELATALRDVVAGKPVEPAEPAEEEPPLFAPDEPTVTTLSDYERVLLEAELERPRRDPSSSGAEPAAPRAAAPAVSPAPEEPAQASARSTLVMAPSVPPPPVVASLSPPSLAPGPVSRPPGLGSYSRVPPRDDEPVFVSQRPRAPLVESSPPPVVPSSVPPRAETPTAPPSPFPVASRPPVWPLASRVALVSAFVLMVFSVVVFVWALRSRAHGPHGGEGAHAVLRMRAAVATKESP
jgi:serine/threonine-protein kinase